MEHKDLYQELFSRLYRRLEVLHYVCNAAAIEIDKARTESARLLLDHLDQIAYPEGKDVFAEKLKALLGDL